MATTRFNSRSTTFNSEVSTPVASTDVYIGKSFQSSNTAGNQTISYAGAASGRDNSWLFAQLALTGATSATNQIISPNRIYIASDRAQVSDFLDGFSLLHAIGGSGNTGGRHGIHSRVAVVGTVNDGASSNHDVVSNLSDGYAEVNQGGDGTFTTNPDDGYVGHLFGGHDNIWLASGATYYRHIIGREIKVTAQTGSSLFAKFNLLLTKGVSDAVAALEDEAGLAFGGGGSVWKCGIQFGTSWSDVAFDSTSTLIGTQRKLYTSDGGPLEADYGIDFTDVTFTTAAFASPGFQVDPDGDVELKSITSYNVDDPTDYERGFVRWESNILKIGAEKGGSGTDRSVQIKTGTAVVQLQSTGELSFPNYLWFTNGTRSRLHSPSDGHVTLFNAAADAFTQLNFGGTSSSFPSIKRSTTLLQARLADDSGYATFQGKLRTDANAATETITADKTLTLYDAAGTAYKVPCVAA